jgi:hypothetical protein
LLFPYPMPHIVAPSWWTFRVNLRHGQLVSESVNFECNLLHFLVAVAAVCFLCCGCIVLLWLASTLSLVAELSCDYIKFYSCVSDLDVLCFVKYCFPLLTKWSLEL